MKNTISRRTILITVPALVVAAGGASAAWFRRLPADLDLARQKATAAGTYVAAIQSQQDPVAVGTMHAWIVTLTDREGRPVDGARIAIDGGVPQHGHGLPTVPAVARDMGDGRYLVEGVKFNMAGWWELKLAIDAARGSDTVTFNILL
ncbi:MAG: FixH family protein [Roseivivax sp.]|nr:FixH family protein [Roseivivax sp.]